MINILLVDDNKMVREGMKLLLEINPEMKVIGECSDGDQVEDYLENNAAPDVIMMDISMPGKDGITVTTELVKLYPDIRIIILTMHDQELYLASVKRSGAMAYILKNAEIQELHNVVLQAINGVKTFPTDN